MYFATSLFVAFVITLLLVSKIAKMLNAKRFEINWVFLALIIGIGLTTVAVILLNMFVQNQEPNIMLAMTLATALIISSAAYKYINKLNWSGALTLNMASMAIGLLSLVTAVVINGKSISETFNTLNISAKNNTAMIKSIATGENINNNREAISEDDSESAIVGTENDISAENNAESDEASITELDLLPAGAIRDIKKKENRVYTEPKFRVISIGSIHSAIGHKIRIHRKNGNTIIGALKRIDGNDAVISKYSNKGTVVMPISIAKIHKLEVYK